MNTHKIRVGGAIVPPIKGPHLTVLGSGGIGRSILSLS